uniref:Uncharacterized protein n=1 Tax=Arundo donax TaxID=35708 RepID=A0A0A9EW13_ARUDO
MLYQAQRTFLCSLLKQYPYRLPFLPPMF